ncbi:MAG TPA: PQQ-binding-like beta-propeller repeat protein [Vicinamibacterales bacterium]|jgi:polyvinyl alcohol dehydrogenase (cytochrome)
MPARFMTAVGVLLVVLAASSAFAQAPDGAQVFAASCSSCHNGAADSRAPALDALRSRTPEAIMDALMTGAMRPQGSRLSGAERRAVAEFLTGKRMGGDVTGADKGRCAGAPSTGSVRDLGIMPSWTGWSPSATNTRFQPSDQAGLRAADVPHLVLKWSFGFPDASVAWSQPTVAEGRVFVGSQNGTVYALNARTGCIYWTFSARGGVRTAIAVSAPTAASPALVYFGDTAANAYAINADTGALVWARKVDDHPFARVTGSPTFHDERLYVPVSSYEEAQGADPQYPCCTFRGSVSALDASSGRVVWKTYMISEAARRRGTSTAGVPLWGPSGSGIWSAPTIDAGRRTVYVGTGNTYSAPAQPSSDAVVALDLETGSIRWTRQVTPNDVYVTGCRPGNPNCPEALGPDVDFGSPPMLARVNGRDVIVIGQKSGVGYAMDPDRKGEVLWQYRAGKGGTLGGMEWGGAVDGGRAYFAVSDIQQPEPGGLHAVDIATGQRVWFAPPANPVCGTGTGCNAAQSAAITVIPGVIFSGSNDGALRAYSTTDGKVLWQYDTNREFGSINGVPATGASLIGPGPVVAGGMVYVNSGYGGFGGRPGNVLLAFGLEPTP